MSPLMLESLKQEAVLWRDDEGFRKISSFFPFFISKAKLQTWKDDYDEDMELYRYHRVTTSAGFTFLVSKDTSQVVFSRAHNNYVGSVPFITTFGTVIKTSSIFYSILSPNKLSQFIPNGPNLCEATQITDNGCSLIELFIEVAFDWSIPDNDVQEFINDITKVVNTVKLNKTLADFQGLITQKEYDHTITQYAKAYKDCMFFVTKGPRRGVLLNVNGNTKSKWLTGLPVFTAKKPTGDVVYGEYEEADDSDGGILAMHKKNTSQCIVANHQGFFLGVKES